MEIEVQQFTSDSAKAEIDAVGSIYRAAYSPPPYNERDSDILAFVRSWEDRTNKTGFRFFGARPPDGDLVGMAYGWTSVPLGPWYTILTEQLAELSERWLHDCFEFVDLAVYPTYQGKGLGKRLYESLFAEVTNKTSLLLTYQADTPAAQMYAKDGWINLKKDFEAAPGKMYVIMGKEL